MAQSWILIVSMIRNAIMTRTAVGGADTAKTKHEESNCMQAKQSKRASRTFQRLLHGILARKPASKLVSLFK